jgi:uncharacterized protein YwqG
VHVSFSSENQLLGVRDLQYDELSEDTALLFQCISDDEAGMEWGDVQDLCFVLPKVDLAAGDFSRVVAVVGE